MPTADTTTAYLLQREDALLKELGEVHDALLAALAEGHLAVRPAVAFGLAASIPRWRAAIAKVDGAG